MFSFVLDGVRREFSTISTSTTLLALIRSLGVTSAKEGCGEGGCGCCMVLLSRRNLNGNVEHLPIVACLVPALYCHQAHVSTSSYCSRLGLGAHLAMAQSQAIQCGFCSPGVHVALVASQMCSSSPERDIEECMDGVLCRCTGYRPIIEAASRSVPAVMHNNNNINNIPEVPVMDKEDFSFTGSDGVVWFRPNSLDSLLRAIDAHGGAKTLGGHTALPQMVTGNTDIGYHERYHRGPSPSMRISPLRVPELLSVRIEGDLFLVVGAAVSIQGFREALRRDEWACSAFEALAEHLGFFANVAVRHMGTIGGSVMACDPLSDLLPPLRALGAELLFVAQGGLMKVPVSAFIDGRKRDEHSKSILVEVRIPKRPASWRVLFHKVGKRRRDAQAIVSAAFSPLGVFLSGVTGIAPAWDCGVILAEYGGREEFATSVRSSVEKVCKDKSRIAICVGLARRYWDAAQQQQQQQQYPKRLAGLRTFGSLRGSESRPVPASDSSMQTELAHLALGDQAIFVADLAVSRDCLYGAFAQCTMAAHVANLQVDTSAAEKMQGVICVATARDIEEAARRKLGTVELDEDVFADERALYFGQPVALVVAQTPHAAREAARAVVCRGKIEAAVLGCQDAIAKQSFFPTTRRSLARGTLDSPPSSSSSSKLLRSIHGTIHVGGQDHFYLEPQAVYVDASTDDEIIHCRASCQNPSRVQWAIAHVLNVEMHRVKCTVKRIGGGFGGKQDRPQFLAAAAAVASRKAKRPVLLVLEREDDMQITGQRHPFVCEWTAHLGDASVEGLECRIFADGGCSLDLSAAVLEVCLFALDGCYNIPNVRLNGVVCRTNRVSNTAFRGFGKPQGTAIIERILEECAEALGICGDQLRQRMLYRAGDALLSGQPVSPADMPHALLGELMRRSDYERRAKEVAVYNAEHKDDGWRRGIAWVVLKNNTGFDVDWMNQGGALVMIYHDGSVAVHVGGVEMGQGLHAKMRRIVAETLFIDIDLVRICETDTSAVPNTSPTAACTGSDLNGHAAISACRELLARLEPFVERAPASWRDRVRLAYEAKVSLVATGYHSYPNFAYSFERRDGDWSYYYIYGACASEVEIDLATGEWRILRVDMVQEVGSTLLNPVLDVGQLEGAFMQGVGLYTLEELVWAADGHLRSRNVSTYKVPGADDAPLEWNIHLVKGNDESGGVWGSKTVGEAGIQHAASVWVALSRALQDPRLPFPATVPALVESTMKET